MISSPLNSRTAFQQFQSICQTLSILEAQVLTESNRRVLCVPFLSLQINTPKLDAMNWATIAPETRLYKGKSLYKWEDSPGLGAFMQTEADTIADSVAEHHCGTCATPLHSSFPRAALRILALTFHRQQSQDNLYRQTRGAMLSIPSTVTFCW